MTQISIAKKLLEGRSCDTCKYSLLLNTMYCRVNNVIMNIDNPLFYQKISKNKTCEQYNKKVKIIV